MRKIELDELKKIELHILEQIDAFCNEKGVQYSLCGGTLLGAVRHKGFIPWDDDIDIFMTRENYDKFIRLAMEEKELPFNLFCPENNDLCGNEYAKAMCRETYIDEQIANRHNLDLGVFVDIFPVDYLGNTFEEAKKNINKCVFYKRVLTARNWKKFFRSKTRGIIYEPIRLFFFILSRFYSEKKLNAKINKINSKFVCKKAKFSGCICGCYGTKEIMPTNVFENLTTVEFEGKTFKCTNEYDFYLKSFYGDYMKLPPEEKRITHHSFDAYWKD